MQKTHNLATMTIDGLQGFVAIVEAGSLNRAAARRQVAQSTLTRQLQALEQEAGGRLLERGPAGVAPTAAGHALLEGLRPWLADYERMWTEVRTRARGQSAVLRIGYLASVVSQYLTPALVQVRRAHPEVKVKLFDQSPGEQIAGLRSGDLDVALLGHAGAGLAREFYARRVETLPVFAALAETHALAARPRLRLAELRGELFVGAFERDMPGHNRWVAQLCRRAGFRARFVHDSESLAHGLASVVAEEAVLLVPDYVRSISLPGVVYVPVVDPGATWDLYVAWQRGRGSAPLRTLLAALEAGASTAAPRGAGRGGGAAGPAVGRTAE